MESFTQEEMELFTKLKAKMKSAKESISKTTEKLFGGIVEAIDVGALNNSIAVSGGNKVSATVELTGGQKLNIRIMDVTNVTPKTRKRKSDGESPV